MKSFPLSVQAVVHQRAGIAPVDTGKDMVGMEDNQLAAAAEGRPVLHRLVLALQAVAAVVVVGNHTDNKEAVRTL